MPGKNFGLAVRVGAVTFQVKFYSQLLTWTFTRYVNVGVSTRENRTCAMLNAARAWVLWNNHIARM